MENLTKLTKENAIVQVQVIRDIASDDERAHVSEDDLMLWFIRCVASGMYDNDEAIEIAKVVKSTSEIDFERWCA